MQRRFMGTLVALSSCDFSQKTWLMLAHVLLQVASREECDQNGTVISTYTVQLYDEGQCHAGQWAARRGCGRDC